MEIAHIKEKKRFVIVENGFEAHVAYHIENGVLDIRHTIVPSEIGGRGIAARLVEAACNYARENGYKIRATCAYAVVWLKRHAGYDWEEACTGESCAL